MIEQIFLVFRRFFSASIYRARSFLPVEVVERRAIPHMRGSGYVTEALEFRSECSTGPRDSEARDLVPDSETLPK